MDKELQREIDKNIIDKYVKGTLQEITDYIQKKIEDIEKQEKKKEIEERTELIEKELQELNNYSYNLIINMVEMSYILAKKVEMNKFDKILNYSNDGINLYGLFVKFCFDKYYETNETDMCFFIDDNLDKCINLFKGKLYSYIWCNNFSFRYVR